MRRLPSRKQGESVTLFPFLAVLICTMARYPPFSKACASLLCGAGRDSRLETSIMNRRALSADRLPIRNAGINFVS